MKKLILPLILLSAITFETGCRRPHYGGQIENTWWRISALKEAKKPIIAYAPPNVHLHFSQDRIEGEGPCNHFFSEYRANGASLHFTGISSTKKMCDDASGENSFFRLLATTKSYTATTEHLHLEGEYGSLFFTIMPEEQIQELVYKQGKGRLVALFPDLPEDSILHLFPILKVDNPGNYPHRGTLIGTDLYSFFDEKIRKIWQETGGEVWAIGRYQDWFICRIPGRYVSSDIALFQLRNEVMTSQEVVAWAWCDEGWCNQQDAWLTDLNQDGIADMVLRYTLTDDQGIIREERFAGFIYNHENGSFQEVKNIALNKNRFRMARI